MCVCGCAAQVATCTSAFEDLDGRHPVFEVPYDILVVAVGEQPATFGVKGVKEYCFFMKEVRVCVCVCVCVWLSVFPQRACVCVCACVHIRV